MNAFSHIGMFVCTHALTHMHNFKHICMHTQLGSVLQYKYICADNVKYPSRTKLNYKWLYIQTHIHTYTHTHKSSQTHDDTQACSYKLICMRDIHGLSTHYVYL